MVDEELIIELQAPPKSRWSDVPAVLCLHWVQLSLGEKVDVLAHLRVRVSTHRDLIPNAVVLDQVAKGDPTPMRTHGNVAFSRHQNDRHDVVDTGDANRVDLAIPDSVGLEQLFEDHLRGRKGLI